MYFCKALFHYCWTEVKFVDVLSSHSNRYDSTVIVDMPPSQSNIKNETILHIISWCLSSISHPTPFNPECQMQMEDSDMRFLRSLLWFLQCKASREFLSCFCDSVAQQQGLMLLFRVFLSFFLFIFLMQMVFLCGLYQSLPQASSWRTEVWLLCNQPSAPRPSGKGVCPLVLRWESRCSTFTFSPLDLVCHLGVARLVWNCCHITFCENSC